MDTSIVINYFIEIIDMNDIEGHEHNSFIFICFVCNINLDDKMSYITYLFVSTSLLIAKRKCVLTLTEMFPFADKLSHTLMHTRMHLIEVQLVMALQK